MNKSVVVQFRSDPEIHKMAQQRSEASGIKLTEALRAAITAISTGDVKPFADIVADSGSDDADAWLYHKCHTLFVYKDGQLWRKSRRGSSKEGQRIATHKINGTEHVIVSGKYYPVKDVVWLMNVGALGGEVVYKHAHRVENKNSFENLMLNPAKVNEVIITKYLTGSEKIAICEGKQRAILINTKNDVIGAGAIERLINRGQTIRLLLRSGSGDNKWHAARTALHAIKVGESDYVLSIS
ncbi:hypothetical protein [Kosakonia sacchari]|uniref:hypothetical protein n=1 Tax=Kosakonia sacchari TaxID=1158459 RepID=UPI0015853D63|nr:hypothetical protein [Kosakonia sacchari]NUL35102.1 hypothetical protein [Kosakonia sacchari]